MIPSTNKVYFGAGGQQSAQQRALELMDESLQGVQATSQQRRAVKQQELFLEVEKAARELNVEMLQNIIEESHAQSSAQQNESPEGGS